ncbi:MAG: GNAT family N-acetyltransferase [Defluviitaleaceae bacterium]|nr:GNAT family N-acetyltransferase [Defluviitaleaceae bacterium]MCL2274032.1 GNAT family N-acetyltransferase [Defluviitaleaceae bacterium]MCL2274067.1 GNAT family N-acetyltransferase [Defluviitaleaceae bacterium]
MNISKKNLTIRNATPADAEQLCIWWNDGKIMAHAGFPKGLGETPENIRNSLAKDTDETHRRLMIELNKTPIGEMNYRNLGNATAEIGIKICDFTQQGKGMGTTLLEMFMEALFTQLGYEKIVLDTNLKNTRAQHVYEKIGFTRLRLNENSWADQLGVSQSSIDYEMHKKNWLTRKLKAKNEKLINMVIERAKRDFPEDIALIGLTGSFSTNDFHEKSDLDLIIVNNTNRGWEMGAAFIFDDVGYDIYCTPWDNLEKKATLEGYDASVLTDMQIHYVAKPEYLDRFNALKETALQKLSAGITQESLHRADKHINQAKQCYADMLLSNEMGTVRYAAGALIFNVVNATVSLNNTCIKRGVTRYVEELATYKYLPHNFDLLRTAMVHASTVEAMRNHAQTLLTATLSLREKLQTTYVTPPTPSKDNLKGWYEECWCNYRNKMKRGIAINDPFYILIVALGAQDYFDEMTYRLGTKKYDLLQYFNAENLQLILDEFLKIMDDYLQEYEKVGLTVRRYDDFDALYADYMKLG